MMTQARTSVRTQPIRVTPQRGERVLSAKHNCCSGSGRPPAAGFFLEFSRKEQFYILTDPGWIDLVRLRTTRLLALENPENPALTLAKILRLPT